MRLNIFGKLLYCEPYRGLWHRIANRIVSQLVSKYTTLMSVNAARLFMVSEADDALCFLESF